MINIASSEFMQQNCHEAVKYYEHALASLQCQPEHDLLKWVDLSKVHISLAQIFKQLSDSVSSFYHYERATECINR